MTRGHLCSTVAAPGQTQFEDELPWNVMPECDLPPWFEPAVVEPLSIGSGVCFIPHFVSVAIGKEIAGYTWEQGYFGHDILDD